MAALKSQKAADALKDAGRYAAGDGLYLCVSKGGRKTWVLRYQHNGRRHDAGLGPYPAITLLEARQAALAAKRDLARGLDPIEERRKARTPSKPIPTFAEMSARVLAKVEAHAQNDKTLARAKLLLGDKYCSDLLPKPVNTITTVDLATLLNRVATAKPETARKLHNYLAKVFNAARVTLQEVHGIAMKNPTLLEELRALGYQRRVRNQAHAALGWRDAPAFMAYLRDRPGTVNRALEFTILTGAREAAVSAAQWLEIDHDTGVWTIPLERLKDRDTREHPLRVPLSARALEILKGQRGLDETWVFPGLMADRPIAPQSMLQALKLRLNVGQDSKPIWLDPHSRRPIVVHGFRATLKTFGDDHNFRWEVTEYSLGHAVGGDVERRYRRTDLLEDRRRFLQVWSDHCAGIGMDNVIALRA